METVGVQEYGKKLLNSLTASGDQQKLDEFQKLQDNNSRVLFIENLMGKQNLIPKFEDFKLSKDSVKSDGYRNEGNKCYKQKNFLDALEFYNKSLCFAPPESEIVGLAYANRSAVYVTMGQYEKALENIELARTHNYLKDKLEKLKDREDQCLEKLSNEPQKNEFQEHEIYREKIFKKNTLPGNKRAPCYIADCLELKKSPEWGRHTVTNRDLEVGTIIEIEEPFSKSLESKVRYQRCANCFKKNLLNLIPCDSCCSTMFCSEECKEVGQEKFHQYDCGIANALDKLINFDFLLCSLYTFFEGLSIFNNKPQALSDFMKKFENSKVTAYDFDFSKLNPLDTRKSLFRSVLSFITHESTLCNTELIDLSIYTALLTNLMLNHTKLASVLNDEMRVMFRKFIFKHLQISAHNSHGIFAVSRFVSPTGVEDVKHVGFGTGFFPYCSLLNHSCVFNVSRLSFGLKNCVVVVAPILKGEQIFDDYGYQHSHKTLEERQEGLKEGYRFTCRCVACQAPAKYSTLQNFQIKDYSIFMKENLFVVIGDSFEEAFKRFERYCHYIQQNYKNNYPCPEIYGLQDTFLKILKIFATNEMY